MGENTGTRGELYASDYLIKKGYQIVNRNYKSRYGEIDLIAHNDEFLVFVEVKTRSTNSIYGPKESVGISKQRKIIKTALMYISKEESALQPRFDVIEIIIRNKNCFEVISINHIENSFEAGDNYSSF